MKIHVGEEKIVIMSPAFPKGGWGEAAVEWGPYEFPKAGRHPDGRLFVRWHLGNDCIRDVGIPGGWAVSEDDGETWRPFDPSSEPVVEALTGTVMANGEYIQYYSPRSTPLDEKSYRKLSDLILVDKEEPPAPYDFSRIPVEAIPDGYICKN